MKYMENMTQETFKIHTKLIKYFMDGQSCYHPPEQIVPVLFKQSKHKNIVFSQYASIQEVCMFHIEIYNLQ